MTTKNRQCDSIPIGIVGGGIAGTASRAQYLERSLDGGNVAGFECADLIATRARPSEHVTSTGEPAERAVDSPGIHRVD